MKQVLAAFGSGALFGVGLVVSQMTDADKVIGFLNVAGDWDPSLALVMVGAIGVHLVLFRLILRRPGPLFAERFDVPTRTDLDPRLLGGAALFGVGWGLGGFCPGPGIVSSAAGIPHALVFSAALVAGMGLWAVLEAQLSRD